MKILALAINDASPEQLLENDDLETVRNLMSVGHYGRLVEGPHADLLAEIRGLVDAEGRQVVCADSSASQEQILQTFEKSEWDYFEVVSSIARLDSLLTEFLCGLADDAVFLIVAVNNSRAAFVVTTTAGLVPREHDEMRADDLVISVIQLAGYRTPVSWSGQSFSRDDAETESASREDAEELVRERLRGLGYIA